MFYNVIHLNDMLKGERDKVSISDEEAKFLHMANDPVSRQFLLARLEQLGLLSAFLAAESGTILPA